MRKNSVERPIVIINTNRHYFVMMHHNYGTLMEPAEVRLQEILRTPPISNDGRNARGGFSAISKLKDRLQKQYEAAYPGLADIISYVIDQEETNARNMSSLFPHLILPGLVEIHMGQVGLELPWMQAGFASASLRFIGPSPVPVLG
jgi:hypothetical protein